MSVTLVWRTDVHLSDQTPVSRVDTWSDTVLGKLRDVGRIAEEVGAQGVLDGGDFFDLKSPSRTSHALVRRTMEVHRSYPCPVYANVGNHDCVYGDYVFLPGQPLGVLFESGIFRRLYDHHEQVFIRDGVTVRVVGIPYHGPRYCMGRFEAIRRGKEDFLVVVAHVLASPTADSMFDSEDVIKYSQLDDYPADLYLFGHWHKDQGIVRTPKGKVIVNIGSLTRGSLSQDDLSRIPSVAVLRFTKQGLDVEKVPVNHANPDLVFNVAGRDQKVLHESMMQDFATHLQQVLTPKPMTTLREVVRDVPGIPSEVKEKTILYVEKAGGK